MDYHGLNLTTPTIPEVGFSEARKSYELQKREESFMNFNLIRQKSSTSKVGDEGGSGEFT